MTNFPPRSRDGAFTLIELLVAFAVFLILVSLVAQLVANAKLLTNNANWRLEADEQARFAFDRIGLDIANMVKRRDVDFLFQPAAHKGSDAVYFFSAVPGIGGTASQVSGLSLVGYAIDDDYCLRRLAKTQKWSDLQTLSYDDASGSPVGGVLTAPALSDNDFHVLCQGVFRLDLYFLLKDGTYAALPMRQANTDTAPLVGRKIGEDGRGLMAVGIGGSGAPIWRAIGWGDVAAVTVTLGVLDSSNHDVAGDLSGVAAAFVKAPQIQAPGTSQVMPAKLWTLALQGGGGNGLPARVRSSIRIYQRTFPLDVGAKL